MLYISLGFSIKVIYRTRSRVRHVIEMKKRKQKEKSSKDEVKPEVKEQTVKEEKKVLCKNCKHLDPETIRDFARHGIREGLIERRGKCTGNVRARGHLVRIDMKKVCNGFEEGVYVKPEKPKKAKKPTKVKVSLTKVSDTLHNGLKSRRKRALRVARRFVNFATRFDISIKRAEIQKIIEEQLSEEKKPDMNNRISIALFQYLKKNHNITSEMKTIEKLVRIGLKLKTVVVENNGGIKTLERRNGKTFVKVGT